MSMSKKDFIALADRLRDLPTETGPCMQSVLDTLADFCASQNPRFKRERWFGYIKGICGPSGGPVRPPIRENANDPSR